VSSGRQLQITNYELQINGRRLRVWGTEELTTQFVVNCSVPLTRHIKIKSEESVLGTLSLRRDCAVMKWRRVES